MNEHGIKQLASIASTEREYGAAEGLRPKEQQSPSGTGLRLIADNVVTYRSNGWDLPADVAAELRALEEAPRPAMRRKR